MGAEIDTAGGEIIILLMFCGVTSVAIPETALFLELSHLID